MSRQRSDEVAEAHLKLRVPLCYHSVRLVQLSLEVEELLVVVFEPLPHVGHGLSRCKILQQGLRQFDGRFERLIILTTSPLYLSEYARKASFGVREQLVLLKLLDSLEVLIDHFSVFSNLSCVVVDAFSECRKDR